ncbi:NRDE family protein [Sinimarinibacterium thermocellulolyticum]|uniref:NRDE family protein n=1 Tax=Sinimarinibacterium thermocellulolyticum TaxID=3170016 RepID=A0ABV2A7L4_9GAMM
MCLIGFALDAHPQYALVLAANRDEFHHRPTAPATWWDDAPQIFGGRDLKSHGSWLALARDGRWAAVTNVRRMIPPDPNAPSRGGLVAQYLRGSQTARHYGAALQAEAARYAGFNLLLGDADGTWYLSNHGRFRRERLGAGVHAVSNAALNTPWPKLIALREALRDWCARGRTDTASLIAALASDHVAEDAVLPDTGVGAEMERFLAPAFIRGEHYGTRSSTVLLVDRNGRALFTEHRFGRNGVPSGQTVETLQLAARN